MRKLIFKPFIMNFKLFLGALLFLSFGAYSQSKNNISVLYGFSETAVDIHGAIGDFGFQDKTGAFYGVIYTRNVNKHFSLESGLLVYDDKTALNYRGYQGEVSENSDFKI